MTFFTGNLYTAKSQKERETAGISYRGGCHCATFCCNNKKKGIFVLFFFSLSNAYVIEFMMNINLAKKGCRKTFVSSLH